ncbi:MAG: restriction endonuclease subunit S [Alphaproteobacteria bacterium]
MTSDWQEIKLSDACSSIDYGFTASATNEDLETKFLRITDIVSGYIDWKSVPNVVIENNKISKYKLYDGDIVIARTGASTGASIYIKNPPKAIFASYLVRLKINKRFCSKFISYYLKSSVFSNFINGVMSEKSAQPNASASTMTSAPLIAPIDLSEQKAIAHILGSLDDKIELNRKQNETLEAMASAIFKDWFVDFAPTKAKMAGALPYLPPEIWNLFPATLDENEIPTGWKYIDAEKIYDISIGKTPPRKEPQWFSTNTKNIEWLSIKDMGSNTLFTSQTSEYLTPEAVKKHNVKLIPQNTVLLSFKLTVGRVQIASGKICTNEAISHFKIKQISPDFTWTYCYLRQFDYSILGSTSSIATAVNSQTIKKMPILQTNSNIEKIFSIRANGIFELIRANEKQNLTLTQTRDALLPKLISGEIRIKDAEKFVENLV